MKEAKAKKRWCSAYVFLALAILLAYIILTIFFESRTTATLWIIGGTLVGFFTLSSSSYVVVKMIWPLRSYTKMAEKALSSERLINDVIIKESPENPSSYGGYCSLSFVGEEIDEKTTIRYSIDSEYSSKIQKGRKYEIEAYGGVVSRFREIG